MTLFVKYRVAVREPVTHLENACSVTARSRENSHPFLLLIAQHAPAGVGAHAQQSSFIRMKPRGRSLSVVWVRGAGFSSAWSFVLQALRGLETGLVVPAR